MDNNKQHHSLNLPAPMPPNNPQAAAGPRVPQQPLQNTPVPASSEQQPPAEDRDLIEQQWLSRAEQLMSQYGSDPHQLSQELYKLRAEYISVRYGKALKQEGQIS